MDACVWGGGGGGGAWMQIMGVCMGAGVWGCARVRGCLRDGCVFVCMRACMRVVNMCRCVSRYFQRYKFVGERSTLSQVCSY